MSFSALPTSRTTFYSEYTCEYNTQRYPISLSSKIPLKITRFHIYGFSVIRETVANNPPPPADGLVLVIKFFYRIWDPNPGLQMNVLYIKF